MICKDQSPGKSPRMTSTPIVFHSVRSENIQLSVTRCLAKRISTTGLLNGFSFSSRPIGINERIFFDVIDGQPPWDKFMQVGFTSQDPATIKAKNDCISMATHDFQMKTFPKEYVKPTNIIFFFCTQNGEVMFGMNGKDKGILYQGVNTKGPIWAIFNVLGDDATIELLDGRWLNTICPVASTLTKGAIGSSSAPSAKDGISPSPCVSAKGAVGSRLMQMINSLNHNMNGGSALHSSQSFEGHITNEPKIRVGSTLPGREIEPSRTGQGEAGAREGGGAGGGEGERSGGGEGVDCAAPVGESGKHAQADVTAVIEAVPLICSDFLLGQCGSSENCGRLHYNLPYQWQLFDAGCSKWHNLPENVNLTFELDFSNPNTRGCWSECWDVQGQRRFFRPDFEEMIVTEYTNTEVRGSYMRRLSTGNAAMFPESSPFYAWAWYWKNDDGLYVKYANEFSTDGHPDSHTLEYHYANNNKGKVSWETSQYKYMIDFSQMVQMNVTKGTDRNITRRPDQYADAAMERERRSMTVETKHNSGNHDLPENWDLTSLDEKEPFQLVVITKNANTLHEYEQMDTLFFETMSRAEYEIVGILRIQNPDLHQSFEICKKKMEKRSFAGVVDVKLLFHGTRQNCIQGICCDGFDIRLSGSVSGCRYGRGSYFARAANYSRNYTDSNQLLVARVLVGQYAKGESHYARPPPKDPNQPLGETFDSCVDDINNPQIFVVFRMDQAYPEYLIDFKRL